MNKQAHRQTKLHGHKQGADKITGAEKLYGHKQGADKITWT